MREPLTSKQVDSGQHVAVLDTTNVRKLRTFQPLNEVRKVSSDCRLLEPLKIKVILELEQQKGMKTFMTGNNILDEISQNVKPKAMVDFDINTPKDEDSDKQSQHNEAIVKNSIETPDNTETEKAKEEESTEITDVNRDEVENHVASLQAKQNGFLQFFKYFREQEILKELEIVSKNNGGSIYVFPSTESLQVWYGVLFVREGLYSEGIFHFVVIFSDDFPYSRPVIRMCGSMYHPQISKTGLLNLDIRFQKWKYGIDHVWDLLSFLSSCFTTIKVDNATNADAAHKFVNEKERFEAMARKCVLDSLLVYEEQRFRYTNIDESLDNPFLCTILHGDELQSARVSLVNGCKDTHGIQNGGLVGWARTRLAQFLQNGGPQFVFGGESDVVDF